MTDSLPWTWRCYAADSAPEAFGPLADVVGLWRSRWPDEETFPRWSDFDLMDFEGWWGQIALAEICDDPFDLRWVLWGTQLADWWGHDHTKMLMTDVETWAGLWRDHEGPYCRHLIANREVGYLTGSLDQYDRRFIHIRGVNLLLEQNGRITHIMAAFERYASDTPFMPDLPVLYEDTSA